MKEKTTFKEALEFNKYRKGLLSLGNKLKVGNYRIHSRFRRVINFFNDGHLASVVEKEIGGGPINIVVENFPIEEIETLTVGGGYIKINDKNFKVEDKIIYNGMIFFNANVDYGIYRKNLKILRELLIHYSPRRSLAFLLDKDREKYFTSYFEKNFVERIKAGVEKLFEGNIESGINLLKGTGFGLTPSGDDFISGVLAGLYILENLFGYKLKPIREKIYKLSDTENLISKTFLFFSSKGEFFERVKNLIISIVYKGRRELKESFFRLMGVGDTSGSDIGTGLFMTLKKGGELWL